MKILFLTDTLQAGGRERQLVELLKSLQAHKHIDCRLVILSNNVYYSYVNELDFKIDYLERKVKNDPAIFMKLYRIIKEFQPDIIHSWESMCSIYAIPAAKLAGIKFINGAIRNVPLKLTVFKKGWVRSKIIFPFADVILANSFAGLKAYGVPQNKAYCIYNGFDFSRINNLRDTDEIRRQFNITTSKVVGMVGRFCDKKDYKTFILSAMKILKRREDVSFLAIGEGPTSERCRQMVTPDFNNRIKFLDKQEDIESIVNVFDIGVLATYTEGISNAIMEYMALAKPVIATDGGGTGELVVNNKTGFLINPGDPGELAEKIEFLLDNKEIAQKMGSAGKDRLFHEFNLEIMAHKHIQLYQKCLEAVA